MKELHPNGDQLAQKIIRFLLIIQLVVFVIIVSLILSHVPYVAFCVASFLAIGFIITFLWLYFRYRSYPLVQEKYRLSVEDKNIRSKIEIENKKITDAQKNRERLIGGEKNEKERTLKYLQNLHIQHGLSNTEIDSAKISGVGPKLKQRLANYRIVTAADIDQKVSSVPGFGEVKVQTLYKWRDSVYRQLDNTKPFRLPEKQRTEIEERYLDQHKQNDAFEESAKDRVNELENKLEAISPRLGELAPITFLAYMGSALGSQGLVANLIVFVLVGTQILSGLSATTAAIAASIPTATPTPPATFTLTITPTSTLTQTQTLTFTPTETHILSTTPTVNNLKSLTTTIQLFNPQTSAATGAACIPNNPVQTGRVVDVVDGDTIKVLLDQDGKTYSVRYIGMDTPEDTSQVEYFGPEATAENVELVYGKTVNFSKSKMYLKQTDITAFSGM